MCATFVYSFISGDGGDCSEADGLLLQLIEIFVVDVRILELGNLSSLYVANLLSLVLDFLAHFSALLKVVKAILLLEGLVVGDLAADLLRVLDQSLSLILLNLALLLLDLLLLLNLAHVVLALDTGLLSQVHLLLLELSLAGSLKVSSDAQSLLVLELFTESSLSFALLESTLGAKSIDLSLTIGGLLLELTKSLDLALLLVLDALRLNLSLVFTLILLALVLTNGGILVSFFLLSPLLLDKSLSVSLSSLLHEKVDAVLLGLGGSLIFLSHFLNVGKELHSLLVSNLLLLETDLSALLDLIDDDLSTFLASLSLTDLTLLLFLEDLKTLNFHHEVELLLLFKIFVLKALVLLQLLITNGNDLRVEDHLVHVLHIVKVVIHFLLSAGQQSLILLGLHLRELTGSLSLGTSSIELLHLCLAGLRLGESSRLLLLEKLLLLDQLVLSLDSCCVSDTVKVILTEDDGIILFVLLDFASDATELLEGDDTLRGSHGGRSCHISFLAKKSLVDLRALTSTGSNLFKNLKINIRVLHRKWLGRSKFETRSVKEQSSS